MIICEEVRGELVYALMVKDPTKGWFLHSIFQDRENAEKIMGEFVEHDKSSEATGWQYLIEEHRIR